MTDERIYIGSVESPTLAFDNTSIESITCDNAVDLIGDELSTDTLEVSVFCEDTGNVFNGNIYGTPIFYYSNDALVGKYYINQVERRAPRKYLIHATSLIGLVAKEDFYGGFYSAVPFTNVVEDILFTDGLKKDEIYEVFTPINARTNASPAPPLVNPDLVSSEAGGYRIYAKFKIIDKNYNYADSETFNVSNEIIGDYNGYYYLDGTVRRDAPNEPEYWQFYGVYLITSNNRKYLYMGRDAETQGKIGTGSVVTIDFNPMGGYLALYVDYVLPGQSEISGRFTSTISVTPRAADYGITVHLGNGFGAYNWNMQSKFQWFEHKVFNRENKLVMDAVFAKQKGQNNYVAFNAAVSDGVEHYQQWYYTGYGNVIGIIGDRSRVARDVELSRGMSYSEIVSSLLVYGWIEAGSKRDALHKLMFSENVCMLKTDEGGILFTELTYNSNEDRIDEANTYDDSAEAYIELAKKISVTEHTYEPGTGDAVKIFDNNSSALKAGEYIALFSNAPISGTPTGNGITILYSNCNAAIVTGRGEITGVPYLHSQNVIQYVSDSTADGKDVSVSGIGLITDINSDNVLNKLKSYYSGSVKEVDNSVVYNGERCGVNYRFKNLFNDENYGFLKELSARMSSFVKAACKFVTGYVLPRTGGYTQFTIATYTETWTVPAEVRSQSYPEVRLNIIGKGIDGTDGTDGEDGTYAEEGEGIKDPGEGGAGGVKGLGGSGGKVYIVTVDVTNVNQIQVSKSGTDTVVKTYNNGGSLLNTYSSASGNVLENGFVNTFNGEIFAEAGLDGHDAGAGGDGGPAKEDHGWYWGEEGESVENYRGGRSNYGQPNDTWFEAEHAWTRRIATYGGGGGAAYGANGGDAYDDKQPPSYFIYNTYGGNGANGAPPQNVNTKYGTGGYGGNGGGGGGGAGVQHTWQVVGVPASFTETFTPGQGGSGSAGTEGIDGCVIIYY